MTDENIYKCITEDMTWSYSRLECFEQCPYKFYLQYLSYPELSEEPNFYSSYGTLCHNLIEEYYKGKIKSEELSVEFLNRFSSDIQGKRPKSDTVEKYISQGYSYFKNFEEFPMETLAVEERYNFELGGRKFVGIIDYLGKRNRNLILIDHKSSDIKPRSQRATPNQKDKELDKRLRQLYLYSNIVAERYGELPESICFNCFRTGTFIEEKFNKNKFEETNAWAVEEIERIENNENFLPQCEFFFCNNICGYKKHCCYADP